MVPYVFGRFLGQAQWETGTRGFVAKGYLADGGFCPIASKRAPRPSSGSDTGPETRGKGVGKAQVKMKAVVAIVCCAFRVLALSHFVHRFGSLRISSLVLCSH